MISTPDRRQALALIGEAVGAGARKGQACDLLGVSLRTVQRWRSDGRLYKYLMDRDGNVVDYYTSVTSPESSKIVSAIEKRL